MVLTILAGLGVWQPADFSQVEILPSSVQLCRASEHGGSVR